MKRISALSISVLAIASAFCALASLSSCVREKGQGQLDTIAIRSGSVELVVELARTPEEQQTGLMHRTALADGRGMLFVYESDRRMAFWMKNTLIPLSIAFIGSDGVIREIRDMEPRSEATIEATRYARYALEVPQGWFSRAGLGVGDRFVFPPGFPGP
ncbi:MAG TPA: DUF192 domain-containing protein [Spirochaetaceae bacterium]|jgi:uncharacterized membrane protein (UPF0127 family)|nr:DUF192 domain-containing protein [Spirochaetaceae bacterium]